MNQKFFISFVSASLLLVQSALGGAIREETNQNVKLKDETPAYVSDVRLALAYRLLSDANQVQRPRRFDHLLSPELSAQVKDWFRASIGFTMTGYALGSNVIDEPDNPAMGDVFAGVMRAIDLGERHMMFVEQYYVVPTSDASRAEGYLGSSVSSARLTSFLIPKRLALINMVRFSYIFNTYEYSPTTKMASDEWDGFYNVGLLLMLTREFRMSGSVSTSYVSMLNGSDRIQSGNSISLSYVKSSWMAALTYANQTYPDEFRYDVFTRDQYRQLASLRFIYEY